MSQHLQVAWIHGHGLMDSRLFILALMPYYGKVMVDAATGKGPMRIVSEDGTEVIRFRKGAKLRPTDRDLKIQRSMHPKAQSHWFEASKAKNLPKWLRVAKEATLHELK